MLHLPAPAYISIRAYRERERERGGEREGEKLPAGNLQHAAASSQDVS
jgi:hypothetical protein